MKSILIRFGDYTKLTGVTNIWKARTRIQNDLNKLYKSHFKKNGTNSRLYPERRK